MKKLILIGVVTLILGIAGYMVWGWSTYENKEYGFQFEYPTRFHVLTNGSQEESLIQISDKSEFEKNEEALILTVSVIPTSASSAQKSARAENDLDIATLKTDLNVPITADFSGDPPYAMYLVTIPLSAQDKMLNVAIRISQSDLPEYGGTHKALETAKRILSTFSFIR